MVYQKSYRKDKPTKTRILSLLDKKEKNTKCWNLLCTRSCCNKLQVEDIIIILAQKYTYYPLIKKIMDIWLAKIRNIKSDNRVIVIEKKINMPSQLYQTFFTTVCIA